MLQFSLRVRLSLRVAFAIVVLVAFVFYSVTSYSPWLCAIYCNALVLALIIAATGATICKGTKRAFGVAFLVAGLFCTWAVFGKPEPNFPRNGTVFISPSGQEIVDWLYEHIHGSETPGFLVPWSVSARSLQAGEGAVGRQGTDYFETKDGRRYYSRDVFEATVNCLSVIGAALLSGAATAAVWSIAQRRHRSKMAWRRYVGPTSV